MQVVHLTGGQTVDLTFPNDYVTPDIIRILSRKSAIQIKYECASERYHSTGRWRIRIIFNFALNDWRTVGSRSRACRTSLGYPVGK